MPPKRKQEDWLVGCADRIESAPLSGGGAGDAATGAAALSALLPFYSLGPEHQPLPPEAKGRGGAAASSAPCTLPSFDVQQLVVAGEKCGTAGVASPFRNRAVCPYAGLRNVGSTCYLNSLLQYLFVTCAFRKRIMEADAREDTILRALQQLFGQMQQGCESVCDPTAFVETAGLVRGEQEDVTELWQMLMGYLASRTSGAVPRLLSFRQSSVVECLGCNGLSQRSETLCELRVRLRGKPGRGVEEVLALEGELAAGFVAEQLTGENRYACEVCSSPQEANCRNALQTVPPLLHIVLDRFHWDIGGGEHKKLCHKVSYPETLDLAPFLDGITKAHTTKFELIGVLEHHSRSADSGHYTATLRQPGSHRCRPSAEAAAETEAKAEKEGEAKVVAVVDDGPRWWQFNDSIVSHALSPGQEVASADPRRWASESAYLLAYRRLNGDAGGEGADEDDDDVALPDWVKESVAASNVVVKGNALELQERASRRHALLLQRAEEAQDLVQRLALARVAGGARPGAAELAVVPKAWLQDWLQGRESDPPGEGPTRVDYSALLLSAPVAAEDTAANGGATAPGVEAGRLHRPALDPFAAWAPANGSGPAKILPMDIVQDLLFKSKQREVKLVPGELATEADISFQALASAPAARTLQELMRCRRELTRLVLKLRDSDLSPEQGDAEASWSDVVLVRQSNLTELLKRHFGTDLPKPGARRRAVGPSAWSIWSQLRKERAGWRRNARQPALAGGHALGLGSGTSSSSKAAASAAAAPAAAAARGAALDLGAGLCCPHGQLMPGLKGTPALRTVVDGLIRGGAESSRLWRRLGVDAPPMVQANDLLPAGTQVCEACIEQSKANRRSRRTQNEARKNEQTICKVLWTGEVPLRCRSESVAGEMRRDGQKKMTLMDGRYYLIPELWRRRWIEHVRSADGTPDPGPLDPTILLCEHGNLRFNPAEFFEKHRGDLETSAKGSRPEYGHRHIYAFAPQEEVQELFQRHRPHAMPPAASPANGGGSSGSSGGVGEGTSLVAFAQAEGERKFNAGSCNSAAEADSDAQLHTASAGSGLPPSNWPWLECTTVILDGGEIIQTFEASPAPCRTCIAASGGSSSSIAAGAAASGGILSLRVRLRDERASATAGIRPRAIELQATAAGNSTGLQLKDQLTKLPDLSGVAPGQLLLLVEGTPLGDEERLAEVLGNGARKKTVDISGEIFAMDLSTSASATGGGGGGAVASTAPPAVAAAAPAAVAGSAAAAAGAASEVSNSHPAAKRRRVSAPSALLASGLARGASWAGEAGQRSS